MLSNNMAALHSLSLYFGFKPTINEQFEVGKWKVILRLAVIIINVTFQIKDKVNNASRNLECASILFAMGPMLWVL